MARSLSLIHISVSAKPDADLTHAKNLIREFCQEEYDSEPDFSDLTKIGIAYTKDVYKRQT